MTDPARGAEVKGPWTGRAVGGDGPGGDSTAVQVLPASDWGRLVAERFLARLQERPHPVVVLPTGATPRRLYAALGAAVAAGRASLAGMELFVLDEFGGLPPQDPARCSAMIRTDLLDGVDADPERVHHIDVDITDLGAASAVYEAALAAVGGIDLAVVGLGRNGHVGLNEPGSDPTSRTRVVQLEPSTSAGTADYGATFEPTWGITMGLGTLLEAKEIWLLVTGVHKQEILAQVLHGPIDPDVPASLLRRHPRLLVLADDEALPADPSA